ncbi:hypothetical protein RRG08_036952 [Elysia crispata]|uniref:Uncharacterized protein n=1 Tax=Elysia crispata TaxID=231223 RepID=A0AAE0YZ42_9GAST|nr:hypothetical protein RRG08_036952 [Elysia crispata]
MGERWEGMRRKGKEMGERWEGMRRKGKEMGERWEGMRRKVQLFGRCHSQGAPRLNQFGKFGRGEKVPVSKDLI